VTTTAASKPYMFVRKDWLARRQEDIIEPGLPIVDPHHHLLDRTNWHYPVEELAEDLRSGHNIVATVYIEWQSGYRTSGLEELKPVGETEFARDAGESAGRFGKTQICAGIVNFADMSLGARVREVFEAHLEAGRGRLKGIRFRVGYDADPVVAHPTEKRYPNQMSDPRFREAFAQLAPLGLSFDALPYHPQLPEFIALARDFPDTQIVLNHAGGILGIGAYASKRQEVFETWSRSIRELAGCPNVFVKIGGLAMRIAGYDFHEQPEPPSSDTLVAKWRPYVETCIEAFGASRCMFESNFPVDKASYSYPVFWNACKKLAAGASAEEKADLFSHTAARFYRLKI